MEVLDLSRRNDGAEIRKTPSPYERMCNVEKGSPKLSSKPMVLQPTLSNYNASFLNYPHTTQSNFHSLLTTQSHLNNQQTSLIYNGQIVKSEPSEASVIHPTNGANIDLMRNTTILQQKIFDRIAPMISPPQARSPPNFDYSSYKTLSPDSTSTMNFSNRVAKNDGKLARPFKAYPRDPLALAATFTATDALLDVQKAEKYRAFRKRMLEQMHASNGGRPTVTNPKMRRTSLAQKAYREEQANDSSSSNEATSSINPGTEDGNNNNGSDDINQNGVIKDSAYYERRKKNNAAAKKSRDRRRIKEDEIAVRAAFLESENIELRIQLAAVKNQLALLTAASKR